MKILFAGINPAFVAFLKTVLSSAGGDVIVASDGGDALDTYCSIRTARHRVGDHGEAGSGVSSARGLDRGAKGSPGYQCWV
jgi:CheY-like chemotaxis protein